MLLSPTRHSTASDLLRVAAAWLMVVLVFQGMAAARALGSGPLHHHGDAGPSFAAVAFRHGHDHPQGAAERHHHDPTDPTVVLDPSPDDALDGASWALSIAFGLMAPCIGWVVFARDRRRHVWRPSPAWAFCTSVPSLLLRPPRRG
jgi:ABC-type nickel/cobalt efflux system permease component RcnA